MGILFPCDPLSRHLVDEVFQAEFDAAVAADIPTALVDIDNLVAFDELKFFRLFDTGTFFYRGWMLSPERYARLFAGAAKRELNLITSPEQYEKAHHITGWLDAFEGLTPRSRVLSIDPSVEEINEATSSLNSNAFVVKDFVKSRKHEWDTACFASDASRVPAVIAEFIRLQEDSIVGGIVVREFVELDASIPEVRVWWSGGAVVAQTVHPDFAGSALPVIEAELLNTVAERVASLGVSFITTDFARLSDGGWTVIEVGDGGVSGLPSELETNAIADLFLSVKP